MYYKRKAREHMARQSRGCFDGRARALAPGKSIGRALSPGREEISIEGQDSLYIYIYTQGCLGLRSPG